jgi:hypothetical protein
MPETQLPTTESAARPMFESFNAPLDQLLTKGVPDGPASLEQLKERFAKGGLTRMFAEECQAWRDLGKKYLKIAEESDARKAIDGLYRIHRYFSGIYGKVTKPVDDGCDWTNRRVSEWNAKVAREEAEKKRLREEAQRLEQERVRLEEAAALEAQGHTEEAAAHLNAPLPPPIAPTEKVPAAKVGGSGRSETTVFKIDPDTPISDHKAFYTFIADHPEYAGHVGLNDGKWKRTLTDAKSKDVAGNDVCLLVIPGLKIVSGIEGRSRG